MDDVAIRLRCLEIANGEHAGTRLQRAEELYKWVKSSAPPVPASGSSGGPIALSDAESVTVGEGFKMTPAQLAKLDEDELRRMTES